jgi:hypothetical protein
MNVVTAIIIAQRKKPMKYFTIDADNNITIHASAQEAEAVPNTERFSTSAGLAKLAEKWPAARLVEIWNSLPGATQVKKFTDRKTAATRIWKAIQSLGETQPNNPEPESADAPIAELAPEAIEAAIPTDFQPQPEVAAEPVTESEPQVASVEPAPEAQIETAATGQPVLPPAAAEPVANVSAQAPDVAPETPSATKKATRAKKTPTSETGAPRDGSKTSQVIAMLKCDGGTTLEEIMSEMGWLKHTTRAMLSAGGSLTRSTDWWSPARR